MFKKKRTEFAKMMGYYQAHWKALTKREIIFLLLFPALYQYMKGKSNSKQAVVSLFTGKWEKGEGILPLIIIFDMAILIGLLLIQHTLSFMCLLAWFAVNLFVWLEMIFDIAREN